MRNKSIITLVAALALSLTACQKSNKGEVIDFNALNQKSLPAKDKAEIIALSAERLVYSDGFRFANKQFNAALELDSTNVRARFYKAILGVAHNAKGGFVKIDPVISKLDVSAQQDFQKTTELMAKSHTKDFLLKGKPTIYNEADAQNQVREVQQSLRDVRATLDALKNEGAELVLHYSELAPGANIQDVLDHCPVTAISANAYSMPYCQQMVSHDIKMNWADFAAAKIAVAAYIIYLSPATAYDLEGAERVARKLARHTVVTDEMVVHAIKQEPKLGNLADVSVLKEIISMGAEGVEALKLAQTKQADLCATGGIANSNRAGFMFAEGFCVDRKLIAAAETAQVAMQGAASVVVTSDYVTYVDASKVLNGSITDLKSQLPNKFDKCQQAIGLADPTLGGTFPRGDFVEIQRVNHESFLNPYCAQ